MLLAERSPAPTPPSPTACSHHHSPPAGFTLSFTLGAGWPAYTTFLLLYAALVLGLHLLLPVAHVPARFRVPLFPATPAAGVLLTVHLFGSLGVPAYIRFGVWVALGLAIYACLGVHGAEEAERQHLRWVQSPCLPAGRCRLLLLPGSALPLP